MTWRLTDIRASRSGRQEARAVPLRGGTRCPQCVAKLIRKSYACDARRGRGVCRGRGVGAGLGVTVGAGVAVGVGVGVGVGLTACAYLTVA